MNTTTAPTLAPAGVTDDHAEDRPVLLAVSYLRVSTREQAERGGTDEGFSIPAQREANQRKADELGARIVHEFVDAGESARSADRDGLKEMLAFIAATRVTFCIVHKLDRLARNRADDVKIHEALLAAGVTLVSATESIDQTPSGMLVHGIMSSIAEFYSRNLATEVSKGLSQKIAQGGTPMRAPIGYLNVRRTDDNGREVRTVEVDPERAPLIRWAFEHYAEGETSVTGLLRDLTARGLVTVPTPKRPSKALGKNTLYKLLTNPYYAGVIRYKGALYPGAHEPIVEPALFDQVQSLLRARTAKQTRHVQHAHHLKGLLHCGTCGSRMLLDFATNPRGTTYAYFVCSGRAAKKTSCTRRAVPVAVAERLVADSYASITISDQTYRDLAKRVDTAFDKRMAGRDQEIADLMANRAKLESESDKLLAAHFADAIDLPTLKRHQDRIRAGLADVNQRLAEHDEHHTGGRAFLHDSLRLLTDAHHAYARSGDADRRLANQAFYTRLDITDDEQLRPRLAEPFATIVREAHDSGSDEGEEPLQEHDDSSHVACSRKNTWVGLRREFENLGQALKTVASRWSRGSYKKSKRPVEPPVVDSRGRLVRSVGMAQTSLKPEQVDELVALYQQGWTLVKLAERFGIHKRTAAAHLVRRSVPLRGKGLAEEDRTEAVQLYEGGATLLEVGLRFGVSEQTVRRALVVEGVKIRPSGRRRKVPA
ncbi:recombinase family protein [Brevibacterium sp. FAM 27836]|uniref:recombinase family protein n=1 Tax=Brevibacterium sp. FAM 27836 TaxID=3446693 RepID=UPI003F51A8B9